jgi:hypothetical protein
MDSHQSSSRSARRFTSNASSSDIDDDDDDDDEDEGILVLKSLPPELFSLGIFPFLTPKALATLHLALLADRGNPKCEQTLQIVKYGCDCWKSLCQSWAESLAVLEAEFEQHDTRNYYYDYNVLRNRLTQVRMLVQEAVQFLQPETLLLLQQHQDSPVSRTRQMSQLMIILDAFHLAHKYARNPVAGAIQAHPNRLVEAPIWCGKIQVLLWLPRGRFHGFQRVLLGATVVLLSPLWGQRRHFEAWQSLGRSVQHTGSDGNDNHDGNLSNQIDTTTMATVTMIVDSYNFLPVSPIGRLVGLRQSDRETIKTISSTLQAQNTVAMLSPLHQRAPTGMRQVLIISRSQARERSRIPTLPYSYYARGTGEDCIQDNLICCWQCADTVDDSQATSIHTGTSYWKQILEARDRGLSEDDSVPQKTHPCPNAFFLPGS